MSERKRCAFCGGDKLKIDSKKSNDFRFVDGEREVRHVVTVRCTKCHARGPTVPVWLRRGQYNAAQIMEEEAVKSWNKRWCADD